MAKEEAPDISGLTHRRALNNLGKDSIFNELGEVGLDISGGRVRESRLQNFRGSSREKIIREMVSTDAIVKGLLSNYTMLAQSAGVNVITAADTSGDQEAADFIETCLDDMEFSWSDTVSSIFSMLAHGFSWHEMNFKLRAGMHPPPRMVEGKNGEIEEKPGIPSKHDDGKVGWWGWPIRLQETLERWEFDDSGRVTGVWQRPKTFKRGEIFLPVEKSLHFRTSARRGDPLGESLLESAYRSWYFLRNFQELTGVGVARDLTGMVRLKVPKAWAIWAQANSSKRAELEEFVANIQRGEYEGALIPDECELDLLSTGGSRQFDLPALMRQMWLEIAISTMTDFALIGHESIGARSLKEESQRTFLIALQGILDNVAETINRFAIPPLLELNNMSVTEPPRVQFSTVDTPTVDQIIESLTKLANAGAEILPNREITEAMLTMLKLPIEEMGENFEEREEEREEMMKNNPLMQPGGMQQEDEDEDEDETEDDSDE